MRNKMWFLPESQLATGDTGVNTLEAIVTDSAPDSLVPDLQTTLIDRLTSDEPQTY